ncbi:MAG: leucine--tRNA ligase [Anaerolineae bacterium]|nr:leucine--tRNA ligase [Anaerolineae bacterium]
MDDREKYTPGAIESKWQERWQEDGLYRSKVDWSRPKHYALTMLPYPSGDLHIGHWFAMTPSDARARWMRMRGYNVLFPMGFDAFGLPAENAAVQRGVHPARWTWANIERMRGQLRTMGAMFDWEREAVSCDPSYYRWTEWFFKQFFENDLAYRGEALVNWSDALQTVLANEQVIDGKDERLGQPVVQKMMTQWFFRYRRYADEMLNFENIDWPEKIQAMQTNWIGRSEGARVTFHTEQGTSFDIFTTRPDTLWGVTFMVLSPEHPLVQKVTTPAQQAAVEAYIEYSATQTEIERTAEGKDKTGVFTGGYAVNPVNGAHIPIWIADYVMITYGTGAIMAVPAGDQRDFEFARKFGLEIVPVIQPEDESFDGSTMEVAHAGAGYMVNSGQFDGTYSNGEKGRKNPAISEVIDWLEANGYGKEEVNYRLRDWLISRQRYWGSPIPVIYTEDGQMEVVPDQQLPVVLPEDIDFQGMTGNPLGRSSSFLNTTDHKGRPARRETDTMDTFMCSSWYHLRYLSPRYQEAPFDPEEAAYWLPVDVYTGGTEHATMHLLYTRWFNKAIRDLGVFDEAAQLMAQNGRNPEMLLDEPMLLLRNQGQVLGAERNGDVVVVTGGREGGKMVARRVEALPPEDARTLERLAASGESIPYPREQNRIVGEIVKRTENLLTIADLTRSGELQPVEVPESAQIVIPGIPGPNTVNQLRHHLEIQRMSKSKGNVVNPDDLVGAYGADTVRAYLMFGFDWGKGGPWNDDNIQGVVRWLNEVWDMVTAGSVEGAGDPEAARHAERKLHQAIKKVSDSLENFSFNTAVAALMSLKNELRPLAREGKLAGEAWAEAMRDMLLLMAPITPHITEELWALMGLPYSIHQQAWPVYDADKAAESMTTLVVMKNGKPIDWVAVPVGIGEADAKEAALATDGAKRILNDGAPKRVIFIAGRAGGAAGAEPKVNIVL